MDCRPSFFWLIISSTTSFLLLQENPLSAHKIYFTHYNAPVTNVTKHFYFSNFDPYKNPSIIQDVKLLGSSKISDKEGSIQIPDASPAIDHTHQAGRAIYSSPIRLFDPFTRTPASFQTTFSFQFNTTTTSTSGSDSGGSHGGGGFTFVIVPDEFTIGRPGPWLGMLNDACDKHYKIFGVEFDTSHDVNFGDPNDDHVGINPGSIVSFKTAHASRAGISLHDGSVHRTRINYDGHRKWIDVHLGLDGRDFPIQPILSSPLDLSPFLKEYMFVGFSASTGNVTQIHSVLSWNFSSTIQAYLRLPSKETCHRNVAHQVSGISSSNSPSSFMIFVAVVVLCTLACLSLYCNSKRRKRHSVAALFLPDKNQRPMPPSKTRQFTLHEVYKATRRFSKVQVLCSDSRGVLYRGNLPNGCQVAMKRFSTWFLNSPRGLDRRRVMKRIGLMTQVSHPNLATIRGWCCDDQEAIVVYDYFQNGTLDRWLFGLGVLPWTRRFSLIKDVAEALTFLHSKELAHQNLKTSSVFLDVNYRAVLGDYGFILRPNESGRVESVSGKKADVFGFGMLVLEIVAGKRTIDSDRDEEEMGLLGFAWRMHERGKKVEVVDQRMGSSVNLEEAVRFLEIGLSCTLNDGPSMEEHEEKGLCMHEARCLMARGLLHEGKRVGAHREGSCMQLCKAKWQHLEDNWQTMKNKCQVAWLSLHARRAINRG
ncbi:hypothetical protein L1049_006527 [Liquidambar formosana]|uniref:Protein kinase domain-containing protein n=1 Tax=Liquidambar formosana TaxID=63359 RepID=A0AAP0RHG0_LIQFO